MTVELIISIIGALLGSGGLIMIFSAGRRTGVLETTLAGAVKKVDELAIIIEGVKSSARHEAGTTSTTVVSIHNELKRDLLTKIDAQGAAHEATLIDLHRRIDAAMNNQEVSRLKVDVADVFRRIENTVSGLQSQRAEWDQLKQDIRALLLAEARATEVADTIKHTLAGHSIKIDDQNEKIANLRAALDRLIRLETELERLKDEISRMKRT